MKEISKSINSYHTWLEHLRILYPISGLLHIGSGTRAHIDHYQAWQIPAVLFIDADQDRLSVISRRIEAIDSWKAHVVLLAEKEGEAVYYRASNPNESGLIAPEILKPLWQNLHTLDHENRTTKTINAVLAGRELKGWAENVNWVISNHLTSLQILRGADRILDKWDVVVARTILDKNLIPEHPLLGKQALDEFMAENGFKPLASQSERHPGITNVIYLRNHQQGVQLRLAHLRKDRDEQHYMAQQLQAEIDQLKQQNTELETLRQQRDKFLKLVEQHQSTIEELTEQLDWQNKHQTNLENQIEEQKSRQTETNYRQQRIDKEIIKFEAQIDLIKDMLSKNKVT